MFKWSLQVIIIADEKRGMTGIMLGFEVNDYIIQVKMRGSLFQLLLTSLQLESGDQEIVPSDKVAKYDSASL